MNLQPIVDYLEANGFGMQGVNLFRHFMPATVDEGILVMAEMPLTIDKYIHASRKGTFQIVVRGTDHDELRERMLSISKLFDGQGLRVGSILFQYVMPAHEPLLFPRSEGNLIEASVNFNCAFLATDTGE